MTAPVVITIPHELGAAEARRRIEGNFVRLASQLPGGLGQMTENWTGNRMTFAAKAIGQSVSGHIDVEDKAVRLEVVLPPLLAALAGGFRDRLQRAGTLLLQKG